MPVSFATSDDIAALDKRVSGDESAIAALQAHQAAQDALIAKLQAASAQPTPSPSPSPSPTPTPTPAPSPAPAPAPSPSPTPAPSAPVNGYTDYETTPSQDANGHPIPYAIPTPASSDPVPASGLAAVIAFASGERFVFAAATGTDRGAYADASAGINQGNVTVTRPDIAMSVSFRAEIGSDRLEVVFEYGQAFGPLAANPSNLPAYVATLYRDGAVIATVDAPYHWWFSRWRWQSAPRPVVAKGADLIAAKLVPAFQATDCAPSTVAKVYAHPMSNAGVNSSMPDTGDRDDIGLVTEPQGEYLVSGSPVALATLLAQAEAAGSVPWHIRDETGAPIDFIKHPLAHWYSQSATLAPYRYGMKDEEAIGRAPSVWNADNAHQPALAYVAYLLTRDPYYLEELQFQTGWTIGAAPYHRFNDGMVNGVAQPVIDRSEVRGFAWSLRSLAENAKVAPASPPSWLLPQSYFAAVLAANRAYYEGLTLKSTDPEVSTFHVPLDPTNVGSWQVAFLCSALELTVLLGFTEWQPALDWTEWLLKRFTDGKSGWDQRWFAPYYLLGEGSTPDDFTTPKPATTIADLFANFCANNKLDPASWPQGWVQGVVIGQSSGFIEQVRGPLALAAHRGDTEAQGCLAVIDPLIVGELARVKAPGLSFKWAFAGA